MQSSQVPHSATHETIIIHHLADLHRGRGGDTRHALDSYIQRQRRLPPERQPNILIIAGDLTASGAREEVREAALALRNLTIQWEDLAMRQHIFIVPGPHDIDWTVQNPTASFHAFSQEFSNVTLPLFPASDGGLLAGSEPYAQSFSGPYLVYLLNTCYVPEALPRQMPKPLEALVKRYRELWRDYQKQTTRNQGGYDAALRHQFLTATDELIVRDNGQISPADVERFIATMQGLHLDELPGAQSYPGDDQSNTLRILVTHHPLMAHVGRTGRAYGMPANAPLLLSALRRYGFHMVLHGHTHEPHFLSDLPIETYGTSNETPFLQIGAGAMGGDAHDQTTSFNEIVATRNRALGKWVIEMTTINLAQESERPPMRITLTNPASGLNLNPKRTDESSAAMHASFEQRLRISTRQFVEALDDDTQDILVRPFETLKDTIKEVIFSGIETRVGLALKQRAVTTGQIELINRYIVPDAQIDDQFLHPYSYPDTVAAWSLVQGDPLIFPRMFREQDALINTDLLRFTGKYPEIVRQLRALSQTGRFPQRAAAILAKLETNTLKYSDIFQDWLPASTQTRFQSFIAVPIPLRSSGVRQRELGVLHVDVVDPDPNDPAGAFTVERVDMLKTLSHLMDAFMTAADKQRRPRGLWHSV